MDIVSNNLLLNMEIRNEKVLICHSHYLTENSITFVHTGNHVSRRINAVIIKCD